MFLSTNRVTNTPGGPINFIRYFLNGAGNFVEGEFILLGLRKTIKVNNQVVLPPSGWQKIESKSVNGVADVEFLNIDQFDAIELVIGEMTNSADGPIFRLQCSTDNGATWITSNYRFALMGMVANSSTISGHNSTTDSGWWFINGLASGGLWNNAAANHNFHAKMTGIQTTATKDARVVIDSAYAMSSGGGLMGQSRLTGALPNTGAKINAIRCIIASGTFAGKFTLLGLVQ